MRCKYCGAKNKKGVKFCGSCGKPMNIKKTKGELDNKSAKEKGKKHRKWWIVIAGVLLLAAGGGYTAFSLLRQAKLSQYQDLLQEANLLLEDEKTDEAVLKFSDAINFLKGQSEAYESLCQVYLDMGDVVAADNLLSQSPEKVKNELADISEEIEEEMSSTFLKTEYADGENIYYGITTLAGEEILPCIYDDISWDQEQTFDVPVIFTVEKDGYFGYIDEEGTAVTDIIYDELEYDFMGKDFIKDYAVVCCDGQYGIVGRDGAYLLEPEYDNIYSLGFIGDTEYFEFTNHFGGVDIIKSTGERTDFQNMYKKAERIGIVEDTLINEDLFYPQIDTSHKESDYFYMVDDHYIDSVVLDKNLSIIEDNIVYVSSFWNFDKYMLLRFNDGKERIYDYDFQPVVQNSFDTIMVACSDGSRRMNTERFAAQNGDIIYVYGSDGTEEYSFQTDYSLSEMYQGTEDDIFIVYDNGKKMLMNSNGELINGEKYDYIWPLNGVNDYSILNRDFLEVCVNDLWGVINYNTGEYIVPPEYDSIEIISSGAFLAHNHVTGEDTVINLQGEKLFSGNYYSYWGNLLSEKKVSEDETLRGVTDINGDIILPTEYKSIIERFNDSLTKVIRYEVVREDGKTGVVDTHGEEIIPVEYDEIIQVSDTEYAVKQEGSWALINTQGEIQIPFGTFDKIGAGDEKNHLVKVQKGNQFGYADNKGNWVISFQDGDSESQDEKAESKDGVNTEPSNETDQILTEYFQQTVLSTYGPYIENTTFTGEGSLIEQNEDAYIPEGVIYAEIADYDRNNIHELHVIYNMDNFDDGHHMCHVIRWQVYECEDGQVVLKDECGLGGPSADEKYNIFNIYKFEDNGRMVIYTEESTQYIDAGGEMMFNTYYYSDGKIHTIVSLYSPEIGNGGLRSLYRSNDGRISGMFEKWFYMDDGTPPDDAVIETILKDDSDREKLKNRINENLSQFDIEIDENSWDFEVDTGVLSAKPKCFSESDCLFKFIINILNWDSASWNCDFEYSFEINDHRLKTV